jgi:hypothetical protein
MTAFRYSRDDARIELPRVAATGTPHPEYPHLPASLHVVTLTSPHRDRFAVFRLAQYCRRELGYDFVQYGWNGDERDPTHRAFLWTTFGPVPVAYGACCFRWRAWADGPAGWALQWVWLHPYARHRGHLAAVWPYFRVAFGSFVPEGPFSPAMRAFLARRGELPGSTTATSGDEEAARA